MHCINISHPDYQELLKSSGINASVLNAKISVWMDKNGTDNFPSLEQLNITPQTASTPVFYQKKLNIYQQQAEDIYWDHVYGQTLTEEKIDAINKALQSISRRIGDADWTLRLSKNNKYYIAGYKNMAVTSADYYSPYANGMFRQLESTSKEGPIGELTDKLYKWAKTHGISIEAMDTLIERFADRYEDGALGVADFAHALIGIAEDARIDTLPEEIAHFAIEILKNDPSVQRALEAVKLTPEYAVVKESYKDVYNNEIDFQKETLGKLLAQTLISEFKQPTEISNEEKGFWNLLKAVKDKFVSWVKSKFNKLAAAREELVNTLVPIAKSILNQEYLGNLATEDYISSKESNRLFSLSEEAEAAPEPEPVVDPIIENKKKFIEEVIIQLGDRMSMLKRSSKSQVSIAAIEKEIQLLELKLSKGELDLAISSFVKLAESEIEMIYTALKKARDTGSPNPTTLVLSENFMQMYENIFRNFVKEMVEAKVPLEETEELRKLIHNLGVTINDARGINQVLLKSVSRKVLEKANTDPYGNTIDPDFDPGVVAEDTHEDMGTWRLQVGNYKYADSKIIKAAHKIVFDSIAVVKRFAVRTANDLLTAQEAMLKSGAKIEDLVEKDADGNNTHYFIREYKWGDYYKKMEEAKQKMAEELGFENYNQIQIVFLNPEELKIYNKGWKDFYKEHTKTINYENEKGDIVSKRVPNNSYRNPRFDEVMSNPATKAYYDLVIQTKRNAINKLPVQYRTEKMVYMVPPILKSTLDRLSNKEESFITRISKLAREALFIEQDETQFGQLNVLNNKMVPIHFIRPLTNITDLSYDVARSVTVFAEMAENFREMNKISGDLGSLQYTLAERNYFTDSKRTQRKKGIESKEYEALEVLLDTHVFGIERKALATEPLPENRITKALGIDGKQFSWTKASQRFATFIRNNNLAFNFITSTSGWLKGSGDSIIEDAIGVYTTNESKMWARGEFFSNLFQVIGEVGKPKQTNKMHLILQEAGVVELERMLYETTKNRATRKLLNRDIMYTTFATGDYGIKGRITLAIYDNYRLYNGQFMTRAKFYEKTAAENGVLNDKKHRKEVGKQWEALREKSLYNAHDVVDGKLTIKPEFERYVTENVLNSVKGKVESVATYVDGTMSKTDKGKLSRTIAGDFLLMHRGWFIGLVDTRFRKEGTNLITEEEEIGTYRATSSFLYTAFYKTLIKDKAGLQAALGTWNTLSPARKRGVAKTALDLLYLNIVAFVAALANIAADDADDEDWTTQYMAYQLNRLLLEQGAAWSPAELVNMIDEPVVGARMIKDLLDLGEMFNFHDVYESGMYEDKYHATKWWMKKLPTRNIYEMQFPELKNRFIKQMVDSKVYEAMTPEQAHNVTSSSLFKILPTGIFSDPDTHKENMNVIVQDLEEDSEEPNEFN
jgi:hypothetical protein